MTQTSVPRADPTAEVGTEFSDALHAAWADRVFPLLDEDATTDGWAMPEALLAVSSTTWWRSLDEQERRQCAGAQAVQAIFLGRSFEAALIQRLVRESTRVSRGDARVLLQEAIEECQHSIWFDQVFAAYPHIHPHISRKFATASALAPKSGMTTSSWLAILLGELLIDEINRATSADPHCGGIVKNLAVLHSADEALHVRTASFVAHNLRVNRFARANVRFSMYLLLREVLQPAVPRSLIDRHGYPEVVKVRQVAAVQELLTRILRRFGRSADDVAWGISLARRADELRLGGASRTTVV